MLVVAGLLPRTQEMLSEGDRKQGKELWSRVLGNSWFLVEVLFFASWGA